MICPKAYYTEAAIFSLSPLVFFLWGVLVGMGREGKHIIKDVELHVSACDRIWLLVLKICLKVPS